MFYCIVGEVGVANVSHEVFPVTITAARLQCTNLLTLFHGTTFGSTMQQRFESWMSFLFCTFYSCGTAVSKQKLYGGWADW